MTAARLIFRKELETLAHEDYKKFSAGLIPTLNEKNKMLGIRIPQLRTLAKNICREDWRTFLNQYDEAGPDPYFEEIMVQGLVVALGKMDIEERLDQIKRFVPKIDNWAVCDIFCTGDKWVRENRALIWMFLQPYLASEREFEIRYGVIMLLTAYLDEEYILQVLEKLDAIVCVQQENKKIRPERRQKGAPDHENYYVEMAVAWCLATAFVKCQEQTFDYLQVSRLSGSVLKKTARKIRESYRVSEEDKILVTNLVNKKANENGANKTTV